MVKQLAQKMQRTCLVLFKALLMAVLFIIFFGLFGMTQHELWRASRTAAISMSTFVVVGILFIKIYGGFPIGLKKTKEIVYSAFVAIFITDIITYFQIAIMLINYDKRAPYMHDLFTMIGVVLLQLVAVVLFGYLGNYLYFRINPPARSIVVYGSKQDLSAFVSKIGKYKKQYQITDVVSLDDPDLKQFIRDSERVFLYSVEGEAKTELLEYCYKHSKVTYITPELSDIVTRHSRHVILDDVTVLESRVSGLTFEQELAKRIMDVVISGIGLLIAGPIMLIEAALIKLEDGGPVFFRQPRLTKDGKVFEVLKFRTMIVDADKEKKGLVKEGDSRITKVGNILRKTRLDELPQFLNIIKGDMSIVGPRPEQVEITKRYVEVLPEFKYRLKVKAGLTGLAQIRGKYNTTPKDKLILDLIYIEQYSIWIDLKLMLQTVKVLFKSDSTEGVQGTLPIDLAEHPALQEEDAPED